MTIQLNLVKQDVFPPPIVDRDDVNDENREEQGEGEAVPLTPSQRERQLSSLSFTGAVTLSPSVRGSRVSSSSSTVSKRAKNEEEEEGDDDVFLTPKPKGKRATSSSSTASSGVLQSTRVTVPKRKKVKREMKEDEDATGTNARPVRSTPAEAAAASVMLPSAAGLPQGMAGAPLLDPEWSVEKKRKVLRMKMSRLVQQQGTINARVDLKFPDLAKACCGVNGEGGVLFSYTSNRHREMLLREKERIESEGVPRAQREKEAAKMRLEIYNDIARRIKEVEEEERKLDKELIAENQSTRDSGEQ